MNRRSLSLPKSIFRSRAFLRRPSKRAAAFALTLASLCLNQQARAANTEYDVLNGKTDLTAPATYTTGGATATTGPTVTSDVTFNNYTYAPAAFTLGSSQTFGSLDDLSTTTITISNTGGTAADTLTLGGTGDLGDSIVGSNAADLLFVGNGANLTITGGSGNAALGLVLGQSGNFDVNGTATISAAITGTANLTRTGLGNLTLSGGINNTGTFTTSGTAPTIYPTGGIANAPAGSTFINGTVGANVTGIVQNGTSDLVLNNLGANYNNGITIQNGIVIFGNTATALGKSTNTVLLGNGSTTANATLNFAATIGGGTGATGSFANPITVGPKSGEGVNVISASDYALNLTGAISLTGGDLTLAPFNTNNSSITINGGITGTGNLFVSDVANNAGNVVALTTGTINNTGTLTFNNATVNGVTVGANNTGTNTVSANIGSNVTQVIENSTNPLTLSGTNTYTGPTTILRGTINETGGSLSSTNLNVGAGTFNYSKTGGTQSFANTNLTAGATISNTIAGTTLSLGTLSRPVGTAVNFGITGTVNIINANIGTTILGGWATTGGGASWAVSGGNGTTAGAITALPAGSFTPSVAGTTSPGTTADVDFQASNTTAYTSQTINSLRFNTAATTTLTLSGTNVVTTGGILVTPTVANNASTITGGTLEGSSGGDLVVNQWNTTNSLTIASAIADNTTATALTKAGPGTLILSGTNTYTGGTYVAGGTLSVTADTNLGGAGTITLNGGTLQDAAVNFTLASNHSLSIGSSGGSINTTSNTNTRGITLGSINQLTGSGTLTLTGGGGQADELAVTASQSGFTGNIVITSGRLNVDTTTATSGTSTTSPLGTGTITINGGTLAFFANAGAAGGTFTSNIISNTVYVGAGGDGIGSIHNKSLGGSANAVTFSGPVILTSAAQVGEDGGGTTNFSGGTSGPFALTLSFAGNNGIFGLSGVDTQPTLTLNVSNNITGSTLQLSGSGTLGATNGTVAFVTGTGTATPATVDLNGTNQTTGTITGTGVILNNNSGTASVLTINGGGTTATVFKNNTAGTGTLGLTVGGGTLALSGASTYSGGTTVNAGALLVNNTTGSGVGSGAVMVNSGGTLGGTGLLTVASATVNTGGTLSPGAPIGATTGALTLNTTSGLTINGTLVIGIAGTGSSSLKTTGALTLSGATLTTNGTPNGTSNYDVANYGTLSGTFTNYTPPAGYTLNYAGTSFGGPDIELDVTAVPEPSTWTAGLLCLGALGFRLRRRLSWLRIKRQQVVG